MSSRLPAELIDDYFRSVRQSPRLYRAVCQAPSKKWQTLLLPAEGTGQKLRSDGQSDRRALIGGDHDWLVRHQSQEPAL